MDGFSHLSPDERAAMDALRGRLRARAEEVVSLVEAVVDEVKAADTPPTVDDGWRCVRLMRQADHMVCQLYAKPESVVKPHLAKPGRPRFEDGDEDEDEATEEAAKLEAARRSSLDQICRWISGVAGNAGFWPNGEPAVRNDRLNQDDDANMARLEVTAVFANYPDPEPEGIALTQYKIVEAVNASIQHAARHSGRWPDGSRFDPETPDPGYYSVTDSWGTGRHRKPYESDGPIGLPWWVVRKTSPPG